MRERVARPACGDHYRHNCTGVLDFWRLFSAKTSCRESGGNARESDTEGKRRTAKRRDRRNKMKHGRTMRGASDGDGHADPI